MDEKIHDPAAGRTQPTVPGPDHDSASAPSGESGSTAAGGDIVTICAWCPQLHILSIQRRDVDVVVTIQVGKQLRVIRNGKELKVSHGICAPCSDRLHPGKAGGNG
jgi:hypothetical protein